jgi:hypothetical protein
MQTKHFNLAKLAMAFIGLLMGCDPMNTSLKFFNATSKTQYIEYHNSPNLFKVRKSNCCEIFKPYPRGTDLPANGVWAMLRMGPHGFEYWKHYINKDPSKKLWVYELETDCAPNQPVFENIRKVKKRGFTYEQLLQRGFIITIPLDSAETILLPPKEAYGNDCVC